MEYRFINDDEKIIKTLALNPSLGAKVRTLSISFPDVPRTPIDNFITFGQEHGKKAAKNMAFLTKAVLPESGLTRHIVANITKYQQLRELSLRIRPDAREWGNEPTTVEKLQWTIAADYTKINAIDRWSTAASILDIAGTVFPQTVELEITTRYTTGFNPVPEPLAQVAIKSNEPVSLPRLRRFSYRGKVKDEDHESILRFIQRNQGTLSSLDMPFGFQKLNQPMIKFLRKIRDVAPKLTSFTIPERYREDRWRSHKLPVWSTSTYPHASPSNGIDIFQMWNIGCSFSHEIGRFFSDWTTLRVLKIGVPLSGDDGRPQFDDVVPQILSFIENLPQSIEELYIELANDDVVADEDEDFDPVAELPIKIFKSMTRLHSLDISAWIADVDRSTGLIPEKAVFCRRRPSEQEPNNITKKTVWVSRLEAIYQEDQTAVTNTPLEIEGDFEGKDADEPWLGGHRSWVSDNRKYWVDGEYVLGQDVEYSDLGSDDED
ncbi:hypothetical protein GLAREA_10005 [Glarea lozoyensis ATCC 20868]|uniref:Uncharacterized protein n=1 Tax=Glarea lozoyensis (strain ATCC 20868 / MF5171) TaxID=1116229 RepID=S3DQM2_GLAL2|nr:uncharacterized protein GLAREA_10005 [Glarea lozoyensis ATCC 20868]EPE34311.1 hypothetical protein GLAREA_10005 [Glarea lozoyensis ATCC 20868]